MNPKKNGQIEKADAIKHLLGLISDVNREMEISRKMKSDLMLRQCQKLKKEYTSDLLELLSEYDLPLQLAEAA